MGVLISLNEVAILLFGCWTLAYHYCLLTGTSSGNIAIPFSALFVLFGWLFLPKWRRIARQVISERRFLLTSFLVALAAGTFTLVSSRPDADDVSFFHRALVQLQFLDSPFLLEHTLHNVSNLPTISILHVATSYEVLTAFFAHLLGVNPVWFYQNAGAFATAFLMSTVYVMLYLEFGLSRRASVLCSIAALIFLLLDGNVHRSFGNVSLVRLWQGKTILWSLGVPLSLFFAHRLFISPSWRRFIVLAMLYVSGVGLSNAAVFMFPVFLLAVSLCCLVTYGLTTAKVKRTLAMNLAGFYCVLVALGMLSGLLTTPDTTAWQWKQTIWWENLYLVIGDHETLIRNLFALLVLPPSLLSGRAGFFPVFLTAGLCLLLANPLTGPLWIRWLTPGAYWRLAYLFPLPWCAGLVGSVLISRRGSTRPSPLHVASAFIFVVLAFVAYTEPAARLTQLKWPSEYKFADGPLRFSRSVAPALDGANLLAPEEIVHVLPLLNPTIRLEATRRTETLHIFHNAAIPWEGRRRLRSQELVSRGQTSPLVAPAFLKSLEHGLDTIIVRENAFRSLNRLLNLTGEDWVCAACGNGYRLLIKSARSPD